MSGVSLILNSWYFIYTTLTVSMNLPKDLGFPVTLKNFCSKIHQFPRYATWSMRLPRQDTRKTVNLSILQLSWFVTCVQVSNKVELFVNDVDECSYVKYGYVQRSKLRYQKDDVVPINDILFKTGFSVFTKFLRVVKPSKKFFLFQIPRNF